jgi:hypothetical protein
MDLFSFSIPYLAEQVSSMLISVVGKSHTISPLTVSEQTSFQKALDSTIEEKKTEKIEILRNKVKAIARMQRIFSNLRYHYTLYLITLYLGHTMNF